MMTLKREIRRHETAHGGSIYADSISCFHKIDLSEAIRNRNKMVDGPTPISDIERKGGETKTAP